MFKITSNLRVFALASSLCCRDAVKHNLMFTDENSLSSASLTSSCPHLDNIKLFAK